MLSGSLCLSSVPSVQCFLTIPQLQCSALFSEEGVWMEGLYTHTNTHLHVLSATAGQD